jgi:hypothetical protein
MSRLRESCKETLQLAAGCIISLALSHVATSNIDRLNQVFFLAIRLNPSLLFLSNKAQPKSVRP